MPPELYNPNAVRICIIKDFDSKRLSDGTYDYFDAKIIYGEAYNSFSPQEFYNIVKQKAAKFKLKNLFKIFNRNS